MPPPILVRTLSSEYRLDVPSKLARDRFAFVRTDPELEDMTLTPIDIEVTESEGFYRMPLPNGPVIEGTSGHCMDVLHGLLISDLLKAYPGYPLIHGATMRIGANRILVAGGKGAGKSTLALYMLSRGHDVEGDEHLLVLPDAVVARPRTLRIKPNTLKILDGLPPSIASSPVQSLWNGTAVHSVSPSLFGRPWRIAQGSLAGMFFAEANHGGRSIARRISVEEAFARLVANTYFLKSGIAGMASRLRLLALGTPAYLLQLGDLASAEWHLTMASRS
ncbi:MAG: hypothetical protein JNK47_22430 [Mesorhizobium sp.]|nr:hypothetical protein [Mesorhizobium sp.]MBL8579971.1 hypothetical protein [Mesorhizobium sp.]